MATKRQTEDNRPLRERLKDRQPQPVVQEAVTEGVRGSTFAPDDKKEDTNDGK